MRNRPMFATKKCLDVSYFTAAVASYPVRLACLPLKNVQMVRAALWISLDRTLSPRWSDESSGDP